MGDDMGHNGFTRAMTPEQRFFPRAQKTDTCWLWTGANDDGRYGKFMVEGVSTKAHRWSYEYHVGPIPDGLQIDHMCTVGLCVNPDHLRVVTGQQNILAHHREQRTTCRFGGHEMTPENTVVRSGKHTCLACRRESNRRAARAKRARRKAVA